MCKQGRGCVLVPGGTKGESGNKRKGDVHYLGGSALQKGKNGQSRRKSQTLKEWGGGTEYSKNFFREPDLGSLFGMAKKQGPG